MNSITSLHNLTFATNNIEQKFPHPRFQFHEDLTDCIEDTADNFTFNHPDYNHISPDVFESVFFSILQDRIEKLLEDFSTNPDKFIDSQHQQLIDRIAQQYLAEND